MSHDDNPMTSTPTPPSNRSPDSRSRGRRERRLSFAVTSPGLEAYTADELVALGIRGPRIQRGGVSFLASTRELYAANLWLRSATRVLLRVATFPARSWDDLEEGIAAVDWDEWFEPNLAVRIRVTSRGSKLFHTGAVEQRVRKVLNRPFAAAESPSRPDPPPKPNDGWGNDHGDDETYDNENDGHDGYDEFDDDVSGAGTAGLVIVRISHNDVTVSVDTSGEPLYRRGYRLDIAKAPLRENLAAALLLASSWDGTSALIDPMCGSGTIAIEAALIARGIAPGQRRLFGFGTWPSFEPGTWASVMAQAEQRMDAAADRPVPTIVAADRDAGAVAATKANAKRAGVAGDLEIRHASISDLQTTKNGDAPADDGWLITNPPYGGRVGAGGGDLRDLYAAIGQVARRELPRGHLGLLVADDSLSRQTKVRFKEQLRFSNGGINVRYLTGRLGR